MAHALGITDGTTTISLSTTDWLMLQYTPGSPSYRDRQYDPVTDSIELSTDTASGSDAQTAINAVQTLLDAARMRYETNSGERVYLTLQLDSDGEEWRSEILYGSLLSGNDTLAAWQGVQPQTLVVTRAYYWEGEENTLVSSQSLTNNSTSNSYYSSGTVAGVLPTPPIVTISNNSGGNQAQRDVFFGINAFNDPSTFTGRLSSKTLSDTAPYTYNSVQASWTLSDANLTALRGDSHRFVGAFSGGFTDDIWWRLSEEYSGVTPLTKTKAIYPTVDIGLLDFGAMRVPTGGYSTNSTDIDIEIEAQSDTNDLSCTLTFMQLFPAANMRHYTVGTLNIGGNGGIVDDGVDGSTYMKDGTGDRHDIIESIGLPLMLYPGRGHRFIWLMRKSTGYVTTDTCALTVKYRPRRVTI